VSEHLPVIVIELVLVFGGALAFAWWQFRDLARERRKRQTRQHGEQPDPAAPPAAKSDAADDAPGRGSGQR
jgi:hypothetical protein